MIYFIPAWYEKNKWRESEQSWYERRMRTEFDDTVKQVQLFNRSGITEYKILLLSYTPNFRHFLHRQGVFHAPYWSCFDCIQEIQRKKAAVFSFHNLDWPKHIEFVYTPFVVLAYLHGTKFAHIEFGEAGNPIAVVMYENDQISRRNIYDDRGFVSSSEVYENGVLQYTDYLTDKGIRKLREYADTGEVDINERISTFFISNGGENFSTSFKKLHYNSLSEVIIEVLAANVEANPGDDIICVAMHELNTLVLHEIFDKKRTILSFYNERYRLKDHPEDTEIIKKCNYIITDSEATSRYLKRDLGVEIENITDISPYDSRMDFGISQELTTQQILVPIDNLPEDRFELLIAKLAEYIQTNETAMVHIFTRNAAYNLPQELLEKIADIVEKNGFDRRIVLQDMIDTTAENDVDIDEDIARNDVALRFFVDQCVDELSVSKCIREQRIVVDMRHNPDLYLQINCISTAIPQIVRRETQYLKDGENGFVVKDIEKIPEALDYFLGTLSNWNKAKVYSYELSQQFTTKKLIEKWRMVVNTVRK